MRLLHPFTYPTLLTLLALPSRAQWSPLFTNAFNNGTLTMAFVNSPQDCSPTSHTTLQSLLAQGFTGGTSDANSPSDANIASVIGPGESKTASLFYQSSSYKFKYPLGKNTIVGFSSQRKDANTPFWSEIAFALWNATVPLLGTTVEALRSVLRLVVTNQICNPVIQEILRVNGQTAPMGKSVEYKQGSKEFYALVGCPNGKGVGYLLFQHREDLGRKTIERVRIWGSDGGIMGDDYYSLEYVVVDQADYAANPP